MSTSADKSNCANNHLDSTVEFGAASDAPRQPADLSSSAFLTVPQLAKLLHVNEKKIYQLAGVGEIPGTKVTGKWIFPRRLIDDWLLENSHGGVMHDRLLLAGSDDPLIQRLCHRTAIEWQQHALISFSPMGTRHGLRMLDTGRIDACFMHWGTAEENARRHMGLLRRYRNHQRWVIVRSLRRNQGLMLAESLSNTLQQAPSRALAQLLADKNLRWALRQDDSGTQRLLEDLFAMAGKNIGELQASLRFDSEFNCAASIQRGHADISGSVSSTALDFGLPYLSVGEVYLDLVMTRKTYFRTLMQDFIARLHEAQWQAQAAKLGGYTLLPSNQLITIN